MRNITLFFSRDGRKEVIESGATTFGELVSQVAENFGTDLKGFKNVVKGSNVILQLDDAELPTDEFTVFVVPTKVDSAVDEEDVEGAIELVQDAQELIREALEMLQRSDSDELREEADEIARALSNG